MAPRRAVTLASGPSRRRGWKRSFVPGTLLVVLVPLLLAAVVAGRSLCEQPLDVRPRVEQFVKDLPSATPAAARPGPPWAPLVLWASQRVGSATQMLLDFKGQDQVAYPGHALLAR